MKSINIKNELNEWLVEYLTNTIHNLKVEDSDDFNKWAKTFEREEAQVLVDMEFETDWEYDERTEIPEEEAIKYAQSLLQEILDNWYL